MLTEISDLLTVLPKVVEKVIKNVPPLKARALFGQRELKLFIALIRLQGSLPSRVWQRLSGHIFVASDIFYTLMKCILKKDAPQDANDTVNEVEFHRRSHPEIRAMVNECLVEDAGAKFQ
jgi:hypothetical protein